MIFLNIFLNFHIFFSFFAILIFHEFDDCHIFLIFTNFYIYVFHILLGLFYRINVLVDLYLLSIFHQNQRICWGFSGAKKGVFSTTV